MRDKAEARSVDVEALERLQAGAEIAAEAEHRLEFEMERLTELLEAIGHGREFLAAESLDLQTRLDALLEEARKNGERRAAGQLNEIRRTLDGLGAELERYRIRVGTFESAGERARKASESQAAQVEQIRKQVTELKDGLASLGELNDTDRSRQRELEELRARILRMERAVRGLRQGTPATPSAAPESGQPGKDPLAEFDYFLFEQRFRGPAADIKERQAAYAELFAGRRNVLDLGCGRGEFVELLTEQGIGVTGIDNNEDMVGYCKERGLNVRKGDLFELLRGAPNGSVDGIFLSQVVEHMPPAKIIELVSLCGAALCRNGIVVIETVNPGCPLALGNFFLDPTHVRPVPAQLLAFILEQASFQPREIRFTAPVAGSGAEPLLTVAGDWPEAISQYQDYAVVAVNPATKRRKS
jgi:2-polyprenyl-3-methyl-5-hydroxy-6-metoxy-1,4-benzoquinol methylase